MANGHDTALQSRSPAEGEGSACPDEPGFDRFFREHYRDLVHFLRRRSRNDEDAEDAAQESLARFMRYTDSEPAAWKPTLYRIAINVLTDSGRRARSHGAGKHVPLDVLELESDDQPQLEHVLREQQRARLREAILALPPKCRQVFLLKRMRGMTNAQVARHCGISVKMVEKHTANAMLQIRRRLGTDDADA